MEKKDELRQRVSNLYVTQIWSSSSGTIKRLVRFAKLTIVEMCWFMVVKYVIDGEVNSPGNIALLFGQYPGTVQERVRQSPFRRRT